MTSFAELKEQYPLRETVARLIGDRLRHAKHDHDEYLCPFHADVKASFLVFEGACGCMAGCAINGREWGDVLDFVKEYFGLRNWGEVEAELTGKFPSPIPKQKYAPVKPSKPISWQAVQQGVAHQAEATPFFHERGVKDKSIAAYQLGKYLSWPNTLTIGGEPHTFRAQRYSIPDIAFGRVRNVFLRLDEADARASLACLDSTLVEQRQREMKTKLTEQELMYDFFGGKFTRVPGGVRANLIFNAERVMQRIEYEGWTGWFSPDMPYVLLHEGQLKAIVMEDACDDEFYYPSIAGKGPQGIAACVGVKDLIIVQDNDPDKIKPDGTKHNAGRAYALRAVEISGRRLGQGVRIIRPPEGFKDADEVVKAGIHHEWLGSLGIEPLRRHA